MPVERLKVEWGLNFNENGELRYIATGEPYKFVQKEGDRKYNQAKYEDLGDIVLEHIQDMLVSSFNFRRVNIPGDKGPHCPIFFSDDFDTNTDKLLLLIQGSGSVRPGVWARSLVINESLDAGSMFPYIKDAKSFGYSTLILNPNANLYPPRWDLKEDQRPVLIKGSERPESHVIYVYDRFVKSSKASKVYIVAHSMGGFLVAELVKTLDEAQRDRIKAVAFTDSVHQMRNFSDDSKAWLKERGKEFLASAKPGGTPIPEAEIDKGCAVVSAGHIKHECTSASAREMVFEFLNSR